MLLIDLSPRRKHDTQGLAAVHLDVNVNGLGHFLSLHLGMVGVVVLQYLYVGGDEQRLLGAVFVLLATAGYTTSALLIKRPAIAVLPSLLVLGSICMALAYLLFFALVAEVGASRGTVITKECQSSSR